MGNRKRFMVNIDVDSFTSLAEFYGLRLPAGGYTDNMYDIAVPRILELLGKNGIKAAFFISGKDFVDKENACYWIERIIGEGHEIANHTLNHRYGLAFLSPETVEFEIAENHRRIRSFFNYECRGFRAPGFHIDDVMVTVLEKNAYLYDSSLFPTSIALFYKMYHRLLTLKGEKKVSSGMGSAFSFMRPSRPHRISGTSRLLEIPLATTDGLKFPFYFSFHLFFDRGKIKGMFRRLRSGYVNYLFHGADFVDYRRDKLDSSFEKILNIRRPLQEKVDKFNAVIDGFVSNGYENILSSDFTKEFDNEKETV